MAKQVIFLSDASLVIGDLTFNWCKKISNDEWVSTAGATLVERALGYYIVDVTITEDTDFGIHITATPAKFAVGVFSNANGDIALQSTLTGLTTGKTIVRI